MTDDHSPAVRPQPLLAVVDVARSRRWYAGLLDAEPAHGGDENEQLLVGGRLVLQLHRLDVGHHHGPLADPDLPLGNGVALWFAVEDLDGARERSRTIGARVLTDVHENPNAGHRELWLRDPDGFLVVLAGA